MLEQFVDDFMPGDHGRADLSGQLLNGYLEYTGDYEGLALLRFYQVYRAMVRLVPGYRAEHRSFRLIQEMVYKMAKKLAALHSRRKKVFKRGALNVPRTLRHNMSYDGAIFDLHWKSVKVDRPKVFAICDVSGSVANYARFMLMFLYSLEEVMPKVRSFAFSSDLAEAGMLERYGVELIGATNPAEAATGTIRFLYGASLSTNAVHASANPDHAARELALNLDGVLPSTGAAIGTGRIEGQVLAGGIAHDFNNLLLAVLGNADLALLDLPATSPARECVEDIKSATLRATELAGQMLAYSGKGRFVIEALDLNEIIEEMRKQSTENAEEIRLSRTLVTLDDHVPMDETLDDLEVLEPEPEKLMAFLAEMEFRTLTRRIADSPITFRSLCSSANRA